jgi:phosphopentomutase
MRALLLVLDGAGCGGAPDAAVPAAGGANTLGELFRAQPFLQLPTLYSLGLWKSVTGDVFSARSMGTRARWGRMRPVAHGTDSISAHWEMAGVIREQPFAVYLSFPGELVESLSRDVGFRFLGNRPGNGTPILAELGEEHFRTGQPILVPGGGSVMQIAAHESVLSPARLREICRRARRRADAFQIARVVAQPFRGSAGQYECAAGRQEFPMLPPRTVLNAIAEAGLAVTAIGRARGAFAGSGITRTLPGGSDSDVLANIDELWGAEDDGLILASLGASDLLCAEPRTEEEFIHALEEFDVWLEMFLPAVEEDDLVIITGDHGRHFAADAPEPTREEVPLLVLHAGRRGPLGTRKTFADIASSLAQFFHVRGGWKPGRSFL